MILIYKRTRKINRGSHFKGDQGEPSGLSSVYHAQRLNSGLTI